jgi:hypothetical protein
VAHACNPTYTGGRDQEDLGLKPAQANSLWDPILKTYHKNKAAGVFQGVGPEFKPQYLKKKMNERINKQRRAWYTLIHLFLKQVILLGKHSAIVTLATWRAIPPCQHHPAHLGHLGPKDFYIFFFLFSSINFKVHSKNVSLCHMLNLVHKLVLFIYFLFFTILLAYINSTKVFHCANSMDVFSSVLWTSSPPIIFP